MNIKSLLLGSAAALVAVSGARAADAVVMAEPEPMEYVRICDMYGTGYFYIPGTETCLKIGGYIRAEIGGGEVFDSPTDSYSTLTRFAPNFTAKNETEYGTLTGYGEVEFNYGNGGNDLIAGGPLDLDGDGDNDIDADTGVSLASAYIDLAGFRIGKGDSQFIAFVPSGPGLGFGGVMDDDPGNVSTGADTTNYISYNFDLAGFQAVISVEEGIADDELVTYAPHVVGGLAYDGGVFRVSAVAAYDANNEEFAGKAKVTAKINDSFGIWVMGGYKTDDGDIENNDSAFQRSSDGSNFYGDWRGGDCDDGNAGADNGTCGDGFAVWGGATYIINPMVQLAGQVSYDEAEDFAAAFDVALTPVTGFAVTGEVVYRDNFDEDTFGDDNDAFGGRIRFQRNF